MENGFTIIACSIFRNELEQLRKEGALNDEIVYLDSMLHMHPEKLAKNLHRELQKFQGKKVILLYGDCHARIHESGNSCLKRTTGVNCCHIFLGKERYSELRKKGAFIILPEWLDRWKEVFQVELGFADSKIARRFMNDFHTELVYIDTGFQPVPISILQELSDFTGLSYRIEECNTQNLLNEIQLTRKTLDNDSR